MNECNQCIDSMSKDVYSDSAKLYIVLGYDGTSI